MPKRPSSPGPDGPHIRKAQGNPESSGPHIRLAHVPGAQGDNNLKGQRGVERVPQHRAPSLLVSYVYLDPFLDVRHSYAYRDWVLDSGAFSAFNKGAVIDLQDYIYVAKRLLEYDHTLVEVFSLDVIGDWRASLRNTEEMWRQGLQAIPTFHYGEPWDVLVGLARDYPKIALGGCVGKRDKDKFAGQCFARVWPKRIHGFGFGSEKSLLTLPFTSVDATNWETGACKYGRWNAFGGKLHWWGSRQNLRPEIEWYLDLEEKAREKWADEMKRLHEAEQVRHYPSLKLAAAGMFGGVRYQALHRPEAPAPAQAPDAPAPAQAHPTVRLVTGGWSQKFAGRYQVLNKDSGEESTEPGGDPPKPQPDGGDR